MIQAMLVETMLLLTVNYQSLIATKACRIARKNSRPANGEAQQREMYETTCAQCGAPTRVPFIPKNDRPIYCSECYASRRAPRY